MSRLERIASGIRWKEFLTIIVRHESRMEDEPISLELIDISARVQAATVVVSARPEDSMAITLSWAGGELVESAYDAFTALCAIRERLANLELTPRCFGACRNLVLSGMAYQMSRGLKGYLVRLGEAARQSDLVRIFDAGLGMDLATVEEQQEFKRMWLRSLGGTRGRYLFITVEARLRDSQCERDA